MLNGEIFALEFIIDQYYDAEIQINTDEDLVLCIQQDEYWGCEITQMLTDTIAIEPTITMTLKINKNNMWSL
jgi:hypothetical protein